MSLPWCPHTLSALPWGTPPMQLNPPAPSATWRLGEQELLRERWHHVFQVPQGSCTKAVPRAELWRWCQ